MKKLIKSSLNSASLLIMKFMIWNSKFSMLWQFASSILSFVVSMSQSSFKSSLTLKSLQCHLLWVSWPFSPNHDPPLIYMEELTFTEFLWLRVFRTVAVSPFPQWAITDLIPFMFDLNFTPLLGSSLHFHLYWPVPSQLPIFVKHHMSLSLGDKEATQLHASLSVQDLSNRCAVTGHQ